MSLKKSRSRRSRTGKAGPLSKNMQCKQHKKKSHKWRQCMKKIQSQYKNCRDSEVPKS